MNIKRDEQRFRKIVEKKLKIKLPADLMSKREDKSDL